MPAVLFFGKYLKIMLVMTNYAKNYASQKPVLAQSVKLDPGGEGGRVH